jgi:hypothetical protein
MARNSTGKDDVTATELESPQASQGPTLLSEKTRIGDGDEALKILHTHYEPYTKEEERRVLRKIDLRLIIVMLLVNGLQFVDKNVR